MDDLLPIIKINGTMWAVGSGLWVVGCGLWAVGCGVWVVGCSSICLLPAWITKLILYRLSKK